MKKMIAVVLAVSLLLAAGLRADAVEINIAIHTFGNEANEALTSEYFKKILEERSNGAFSVNVFPNGTLGTEVENIAQMKSGEIECALLSANAFQQLIPEYEATGIPFSFPSAASVDAYWSGPLGDVMKAELDKRNNTMLIGLLHRGPRMLTATREIKTPAELKGLKLRVPEIKSWITVWKSMGALPTPVNMNEVYTALQTRVVEGQENPIDTIYGAKLPEVQSHTMLTEHLYSCFYWTYNTQWFNKLPADQQKLVMDCTVEALKWGNDNIAQIEKDLIEKMKSEGNIIVPVDKKEWMAAARDGVIEAAQTLHPDARAALMENLK